MPVISYHIWIGYSPLLLIFCLVIFTTRGRHQSIDMELSFSILSLIIDMIYNKINGNTLFFCNRGTLLLSHLHRSHTPLRNHHRLSQNHLQPPSIQNKNSNLSINHCYLNPLGLLHSLPWWNRLALVYIHWSWVGIDEKYWNCLVY